jgi:ABC-2 type transport system permease protein
MNAFASALWSEFLKAFRSRAVLLSAVFVLILPLAGALFMAILKDPEQARAAGIIGAKAQLTMGTADWPSYFNFLGMGIGAAGLILFSMITAWVFGREFSDHTAKEWLATPTPRATVVAAKFALIAVWILFLTLLEFSGGLLIGSALDIPGWTAAGTLATFATIMAAVFLVGLLMPLVAWWAGLGRGYLPPIIWMILTMGLANMVSLLGRGDWFPWAVPILVSGMIQKNADRVGLHSYLVVGAAFLVGIIVTFLWWRNADHSR